MAEQQEAKSVDTSTMAIDELTPEAEAIEIARLEEFMRVPKERLRRLYQRRAGKPATRWCSSCGRVEVPCPPAERSSGFFERCSNCKPRSA